MARTRAQDSGVTLIEVLVVLALIGISAGIVVYALPSGAPARTLKQEAELLSARLNLAVERSLVESRDYRLDWDGQSYRLEHWQEDEWTAATGLAEPHQLPDGAVLTNGDGGGDGVIKITADLMPAPTGIITLRLAAGNAGSDITFDGASAHAAVDQP